MTPVTTSRPATHKDSAKAEKVLKKATKSSKAPAAEENNGSSKSKTWGLNLTATIKRLFDENHKNHWDDDKIIQFMLAEFPNRENKNILYNVREMRWRYNFGKLSEDKDGNPHPPKVQAEKYNKDGTIYEKKVSKPGLTPEEKAAREAERKERAGEDRAKLQELIEKAEERVTKLHKKLADHIEKYGEIKKPKAEPKTDGKKVVKVAKKK